VILQNGAVPIVRARGPPVAFAFIDLIGIIGHRYILAQATGLRPSG
jgi:hypothetical protein